MLRRKIGDFYLVSLIGTGGMSQVFLGLNPRTREKRAVKILAKRATGMAVSYARFLREVEIVRGLSHSHIVRILDSGTLDDCYFYMMEYLAGGNLAHRISKGRMELGEAVAIFTQVCDAMAYAHDRGIIHRDLKPANVLLTPDGSARVSDFGIAKTLDGNAVVLTRSNEIMGTIAYLAPEQRFNTKCVDRRADVYALGAILYEMVMGFPPLGNFPWPRETQPSFPAALQNILEKCLIVLPGRRFPHAGFLRFELEKYCSLASLSPMGHECNPASDQDPAKEDPTDSTHSDRMEGWLQTLQSGTTRERLSVVREMIHKVQAHEAKAILKLFTVVEDRVRWGLIRVLGELKVPAAAPMIIKELKNPYLCECAIEALGNIGSEESFHPIREFVLENPSSATIALLPLARTGKSRAVKILRHYLSSDMAVVRQTAVRALAAIDTPECLNILSEHLNIERDDKVRSAVQQALIALEAVLRERETFAAARPASCA